jgi:hypothetical protein
MHNDDTFKHTCQSENVLCLYNEKKTQALARNAQSREDHEIRLSPEKFSTTQRSLSRGPAPKLSSLPAKRWRHGESVDLIVPFVLVTYHDILSGF